MPPRLCGSIPPISARKRRGSGSQDLFHRLPLREFVDELIEVADVLHEGVLDFLHADAADGALDLGAVWVEAGGLGEEGLERGLGIELVPQGGGGVAGQPVDDPVNLLLRSVLPLGFLDADVVHRSRTAYRRCDGWPWPFPGTSCLSTESARNVRAPRWIVSEHRGFQ